MHESQDFDYIVAGGGLCGCVVAARLKESLPGLSIALIEAGSDVRANPHVLFPSGAFALAGSDCHYINNTIPQENLNSRIINLLTGRALGGGSAVNYGAWTRGDRSGYDEWAAVVGDARWSYERLLPYMKRAETYSLAGKENEHGYSGPLKLSSGGRGYPLRTDIREAMLSLGLSISSDMNDGDSQNIVAPLVESWYDGLRSFAANAYDLGAVDVFTECSVARILVRDGKATGVELADGRELRARKEVIVSCGAIRTPQLLMLSGIGPENDLRQLNIEVAVDSPDVGRNLYDHPFLSLWFKLRNPEAGLAVGSANFNNPKYFEGNPMDWFSMASVPVADINKALEVDGQQSARKDNIEISCMYIATPTSPHPSPPIDGSALTISTFGLSVTSRGQVRLTGTDIRDDLAVDPAYLSTEHDRVLMRAGLRMALKMMESEAGRRVSIGEIVPATLSALSSDSTDQELDNRVKASVISCYHPAGTAAMGKVVDTDCRVIGVRNLRIVDASILPVSIGAHLQAPLYGIAEMAADIIIKTTQ